MNLNKILTELKERRRALEEAIAALELLKKHQAPKRVLPQVRARKNEGKHKLRSSRTRTNRPKTHAGADRGELIVFPMERRVANGENVRQ